MTLRIAALVKQIPAFESLTLGPDGRLVREGLELEMSAYCRRAVAQAVALAASHDGTVTVVTLGPPAAEDTLREAIAWGRDRDVDIRGVLVSDPRCAGSDTLATARALAATITRLGDFDLVLTGRNSVDADTGQVGPELAELLGLPFVTGARHLSLEAATLDIRAEHDDGWAQVQVGLPAVVSTAERLIDPCKVDPAGRAAVPAELITRLDADDLGSGPWGADASPTRVGQTRTVTTTRARCRCEGATVREKVAAAVAALTERGALDAAHDLDVFDGPVPMPRPESTRTVGVVVEPDRAGLTRELLGAAATMDARVVALTTERPELDELGGWGADVVLELTGIAVANEEDTAAGVIAWARAAAPWAVLAPGTAWGREVASRTAAALGTGLTGDAVELAVHGDELVAWKPAFGGQLVAAIHCATRPQMATVRAGVLPRRAARPTLAVREFQRVTPHSRVTVLARTRDDDLDLLADASAVVGVGRGVEPSDYPMLDGLLAVLGAELAATRKVTDMGWLPRARQIGITGRSIAPRLYVSIGASGKFNHIVGIRTAQTVLAVNPDPAALVHDAADVSIVGDYREVVPALTAALRARPR
ncbi:MAG: FAD-binding protein [Acidimicrobiia bacterium]